MAEAIVTISASDARTTRVIEDAIRTNVPKGTAIRFTQYDGPTGDHPTLAHTVTLSAEVSE